jgi:hypothetical protein
MKERSPMSKFLNRLLETGKFPEAVCDYIVEAFKGKYLEALTKNPSFMGYGATLLRAARTGDIRAVLMMGDVSALDAFLDVEDWPAGALKVVMELWYLSDNDQLRLVQRSISDELCDWLLGAYALAPAARMHLLTDRHYPGQVFKDAPTREESELREYCSGQHKRGPETEESVERVNASREHRDKLYASDKGKLNWLSIVGRLDDTGVYLSGEFGLGDSTESLNQWRTFFKIADSDCDAPLANVIRTAKILSLSK